LEVQGLVSIRAGRGTGTTVGTVHHSNLARTLTLYLHMTGATYAQLLDAWVRSEPLLAQLAAENKDRARVRKLLTPFLQSEWEHDGRKRPWNWREGLEFHRVVADLANNPVLSLTLSAIADIHTDHLLSLVIRRDPSDDAFFVHDHIQIAKAIIAGEAENARNLMEEHARHTIEEYKSYWPRQVGERIEWR
jgi:GntR family transcriptional repressor for pyruvate dehydrogenase complex